MTEEEHDNQRMGVPTGELDTCPFCGIRPRILSIGRDWWMLTGDHTPRCILQDQDLTVPRTAEQLRQLEHDWNRRD